MAKTKRSEDKQASKAGPKQKQQKPSPDSKPKKSASELKAEREQREAGLDFSIDFYLLKKDPNDLSIDEIEKHETKATEWEGVRTAPAAKVLRTMEVGNKALLFATAKKEPGIVGILEVVKAAYPDASQFDKRSSHYDKKSTKDDPKWDAIDVKLTYRLDKPITLAELKEHKDRELKDLPLFTNKRLTVMPLTQAQWDFLVGMIPGYLPGDEDEDAEKSGGASEGKEEEAGEEVGDGSAESAGHAEEETAEAGNGEEEAEDEG